MGLSPRVRGNPKQRLAELRGLGSIPAGAGEPFRVDREIPDRGVYPRGCGGTPFILCMVSIMSGLSPRVRGNRRRPGGMRRRRRSIPAGAGEPPQRDTGEPGDRVYPRGCGGTHRRVCAESSDTGLSPRVRGNRLRMADGWQHPGSIPAGAGEPLAGMGVAEGMEVYPRGCGGTSLFALTWTPKYGLSPRVRGNRGSAGLPSRFRGSIPAGAGEPAEPGAGREPPPVYPRGCGGTVQVRC